MGLPTRRRLATLIRVRQEIDKRLDPLLQWRVGPSEVLRLLCPEVAAAVERREQGDDTLRARLAARAATRFPLTHLARRAVSELPARAELTASIADSARGAWSVFGSPLQVAPEQHDWTRHPISGARAGDDHWTRVSYMRGVGGGDVKVIWELSRHHHLVRLAQGYFLDRDERLAEQILALLDRWIEQNPAARGVNWTSSLEVAFRAVAWCWLWALTCESRAWTRTRTERFVVSLWQHARHVERYDSIHHSPNTHLTGEGLGLLYVGLCFPDLARASLWAERGRSVLESELDAQVLADGMHFERAVGYHRYTAEFYLHYLLLADATRLPVPDHVRRAVLAQVDAASTLRRPDGTWPVIGDEDSGDTLLLTTTNAHDQGPLLAVGGAMFREPSLMALAGESHRAAGWWLLDDASWRVLQGASAMPAVRRSASLPSAGYYVGRDGDGAEDWWCLVDAGPHGGDSTGHAHTDLGHVEIAHGATHIVTDPGCAAYTTDLAARDRCRSETSHACLVIDGAPLAEPAGPFSWARVSPLPTQHGGDTDEVWWCELTYDRPSPNGTVRHHRQVVLVRGRGVVVCDWLDGAVSAFAVHWPLADRASDLRLSGDTLAAPAYALSWSVTGGSATATLDAATRSPAYGRVQPSAMLRVMIDARGRAASSVTCFAESSDALQVAAHDGETVRITYTTRGDVPATLTITRGASPTSAGISQGVAS